MTTRFLLPVLLAISHGATAQPVTPFNIQAALDALPETGGIVRVPAGTYEISAPLVIGRSDVRLEGAGAATHIVNRNTQRQP
ncbi:MAG: hypothetical protein ACREF9_19735, partial [Opitutaceae bacterium]